MYMYEVPDECCRLVHCGKYLITPDPESHVAVLQYPVPSLPSNWGNAYWDRTMHRSQRRILTIQVLRDCSEPTVTTTAWYANALNCCEGVADALPSPEAGMLSRPSAETCPPLLSCCPFHWCIFTTESQGRCQKWHHKLKVVWCIYYNYKLL